MSSFIIWYIWGWNSCPCSLFSLSFGQGGLLIICINHYLLESHITGSPGMVGCKSSSGTRSCCQALFNPATSTMPLKSFLLWHLFNYCAYAVRSQKTTCGSLFFPPPRWLPDIKLKPTVLVAFATICLLRHLVGPDNVVYPGSKVASSTMPSW